MKRALVLLALGACRTAPPAPASPSAAEQEPAASSASEPEAAAPASPVAPPAVAADALPADARVALTAGGRYRVAWRSEQPPEPGRALELEVWALDAASGAPAAGASLAADAAMPEHEHGLVRLPRVLPIAAGRWRVEGLYLHMLGRWELYLDLSEGARTERASWELWLE